MKTTSVRYIILDVIKRKMKGSVFNVSDIDRHTSIHRDIISSHIGALYKKGFLKRISKGYYKINYEQQGCYHDQMWDYFDVLSERSRKYDGKVS